MRDHFISQHLHVMRYILIFFLLAYAGEFYAQKKAGTPKPQSKTAIAKPKEPRFTKKQFVKDSIEIMKTKLVRPQFRIDNREIFFKGQPIAMNGIDAGVLLKNKLRLTLGYHWLNDNLNYYRQFVDNIQIDRQIKLRYGSLNTEFIYKNTRFFSLGMPLEFGLGKNELIYKDVINNVVYSKASALVFVTDFGLSATFKPIRWIGIKGIIGYRKTLFDGVKDFHFDGFFTSLGLNVDFREIIKDIRMFNLKRKYKRGNNISNAVDLITD